MALTNHGKSIRLSIPTGGGSSSSSSPSSSSSSSNSSLSITVSGALVSVTNPDGGVYTPPPTTPSAKAPASAAEAAAAAAASGLPEPWHNWAGNVAFQPGAWHEPRTEGEICAIVAAAHASSRNVRVVGVGHSFNAMNAPSSSSAATDGGAGAGALSERGGGGDAISLMFYKKVLAIDRAPAAGQGPPTVTCQAGINLVLLLEALEEAGLTLPNLPIVTSVTLGGALGTGAHGSGTGHGLLSGLLLAARLVTGDGSVLVVDGRPGPTQQNAAVLPALKVSLGALGVLTEVTLACVVDFALQVRELQMPLADCLATLPKLCRDFEYFKAWWVPHTGFVQAFLIDRDGGCMDDPGEGYGTAAEEEAALAEAMAATAAAEAALAEGGGSGGGGGGGDSGQHGPAGAALRAHAWLGGSKAGAKHMEDLFLLNARDPSSIPFVNGALRLPCLTPKRAVGRACSVITNGHWQNGNESNGCRFDVLEYALPAEHAAAAIRQYDALLAARGLYVSFPVDIRFSKRDDDCWLSPAYGFDACWVGIPAKRPYGEETEHDAAFAAFEEVMVAHGGRPHWAKQHTQPAAFFAASFPKWEEFHAVRRRLDPQGTFLNDYLRELFALQPWAVPARGKVSAALRAETIHSSVVTGGQGDAVAKAAKAAAKAVGGAAAGAAAGGQAAAAGPELLTTIVLSRL